MFVQLHCIKHHRHRAKLYHLSFRDIKQFRFTISRMTLTPLPHTNHTSKEA